MNVSTLHVLSIQINSIHLIGPRITIETQLYIDRHLPKTTAKLTLRGARGIFSAWGPCTLLPPRRPIHQNEEVIKEKQYQKEKPIWV